MIAPLRERSSASGPAWMPRTHLSPGEAGGPLSRRAGSARPSPSPSRRRPPPGRRDTAGCSTCSLCRLRPAPGVCGARARWWWPATAGHAATVTLDPARLGANGCRGSLSARVTELESATRAERTMCPQLVRRVGVVAGAAAAGRQPRGQARRSRRAPARAQLPGTTGHRSGMSDRQPWLEEPCPTCGARSALRCQTTRYGAKPARFLHAARGWRHRPCPTCMAPPGQLCKTPTGRRASQPHTTRLQRGRRELFAEEQVWEELERWEAAVALVCFSGGRRQPGQRRRGDAGGCEEERACPLGKRRRRAAGGARRAMWGRYAVFRGHPRISGLLMWHVQERQAVIAGERSGQKFEELVSAPRQLYRPAVTPVAVITADTSRRSAARARRDTSRGAGAGDARLCERCGEPLPAGLRPDARYCSKRCRQAASRTRLKDRPPSPPPSPPETCSWCRGPMPAGVRVEARFCSKRCRQASSRHALRVRRSAPKTSRPHNSPRPRGAKAQR